MRVIGTAGHVDHGKSTLVRRLTGIDPDRLAEEKAREMTIDLGFAWLSLDDGEVVGIVDVPGHRDFIENMLAGVGGIDAAVLVVAADEGVMPQTREHLAILDLLGVENGLVALTKTDMVDDSEWLELVEQEVYEILQGTSLAGAEIIPVSAHTGQGIENLLLNLSNLLNDLPPRIDYNHPRLPIDRVFTVKGFGTVVTGTLSGGTLEVGDDIEISPSARKGRIRGLQSYKQPVEVALPGSRVAVNISGIDKNEVERGQVLTYPGQISPTILLDAYFKYLPDLDRALQHNAEVKFFSGSSESVARVRLLGDEALKPGMEGWIQLRLETAVALSQKDRFILRFPSPPQTIGGGVVVNPHPGRRWKRFQKQVIRSLETRMQGTPAERVVQAVEGVMPVKRVHVQKSTGYSDDELDSALNDALTLNLLVMIEPDTYMTTRDVQLLLGQMESELASFHQSEPLRRGMPREELRSRVKLKGAVFNALLEFQERILAENSLLYLDGHEVKFTPQQQAQIDALMAEMNSQPYTPPSYSDAVNVTGEKLLRALIDLGEIVQIQKDVILTHVVYEEMVSMVLDTIDMTGSIQATVVRDHFNTTRKYAIGLLEHLDSVGVTRRVGDDRVRARRG